MKKIKLILEYTVGEYDDNECLVDSEVWEEIFYSRDVCLCDLDIIDVKIIPI